MSIISVIDNVLDNFPFPGVGKKCMPATVPTKAAPIPPKYRLDYWSVISSTNHIPTATVRVAFDGQVATDIGMGETAFAAICDAISKAVKQSITIQWYSSPSICRGMADMVEFRLRLYQGEQTAMGYGAARDYNEASAKAVIDGLNRLAAMETAISIAAENNCLATFALSIEEPGANE